MKKFTLSILFLFVVGFITADTIEKTYYFSDYTISTKGDFQIIEFENTLQTGLAGQPTFPYHAVSLLLPPGEIVSNLEFIGEEEKVIDGSYQLLPYQPSVPLSIGGDGNFLLNEDIYLLNSVFPLESVGKYSTSFMNGFGFALSSFTPIRYIPATGQISYFQKVTIKITTETGEKALKALENHRTSSSIESRVCGLAQNPDNYKLYPVSKRSADDYRYLIITKEQFVDDFTGLQDLYFERGMKTNIVTTEYIASNIAGQDLQEKIRNYIIDQYQNYGTEFVLLGGDVEHVPFRGFYCYVESGSGYTDNGIPADLYYSALDGSWNEDGDNSWGEPEEDDLLPEIAVARFPFSNVSELESQINKSTLYQNSPVEGDLRHALMAGEYLYSDPDTWGNDYLELLIGERDDNGYTTIGIPEDYNFTKLYEEEQSWSGSQLINEINQGKQFVHHVGHANETYVAYLSNSDITNSNFSGANGTDHNFMLFQSHGCNCGNFEYSDCILEKMVNIDNCAVAVVGNARYGWFNEGQTEGPAAHLHREMVDAMYFEKLNHIGQAFLEAKIQTAPWVEAAGQWEEGALRWNFYDINILGDPGLAVWTDEPIDIDVNYDTQIPIGVSEMSINVSQGGNPLENFSCSVKFNGVICGWGMTNSSGSLNLVFDEPFSEVGNAELVVVGYNCLPHSYDIQIIPNEGAYIVFNDYEINDESGNNDGIADYNESITLDVSLENVGTQTANNVSVTLSTLDSYVDINDNTENFGNINSGEIVNIQDAFAFDVANNIPDQESVIFDMQIDGDSDSWNSEFQIVVNAPFLETGSLSIDDIANGNGNGLLDPGETADIIIESFNNGHSDCSDAMAFLATTNEYITINNDSFNLGDLTAGSYQNAVFSVSVSGEAPIGDFIDFDFSFESGAYEASQIYYISIGLIVEDFETGDFTRYDWETGGDAPWIITPINPYEGTYCAKSGIINDEQTSELTIEMEIMADDEITFMFKVSSEDNYDYLRFYIDNTLMDEWSGEVGWQEVTYDVSAGDHTFIWSYDKDYSVSNGDDCGWVDYIEFPASALFVGSEDISLYNGFTIYPNPSSGMININNNDWLENISVYDLLGSLVYEQQTNLTSPLISINLSALKEGIYIIHLTGDKSQTTKKIIIKK